jgi:FeS assembly SUF system regulator
MLRVTKLTDYATVVLTVLAAPSPGAPTAVLSAPELAERAGLEVPTVAKLLKPLAQAGLVEGFRGANGGYRLARPADQIGLLDIVIAMEGPLGMTECSVHDGNCGIEQSCGVRANWRRINDVVVDALRAVTLAQMLAPPPAAPPSSDSTARRIDVRLASA